MLGWRRSVTIRSVARYTRRRLHWLDWVLRNVELGVVNEVDAIGAVAEMCVGKLGIISAKLHILSP